MVLVIKAKVHDLRELDKSERKRREYVAGLTSDGVEDWGVSVF